ncbi:hypothetical protein GCM10009853_031120 [Glycomyces scopariae]
MNLVGDRFMAFRRSHRPRTRAFGSEHNSQKCARSLHIGTAGAAVLAGQALKRRGFQAEGLAKTAPRSAARPAWKAVPAVMAASST